MAEKNVPLTPAERRLGILAFLVYFINYFTRCNFPAALVDMVQSLGTTELAFGIALTATSIAYGAGQVICGVIGDRISPRHFIAFGLFGTSACNLLVGLLHSVPAITVIWGLNGLFQAMIWPPLVRIMSENMTPSAYKRTVLWVSYSCSLSTIVVYLGLVPLSLWLSSWRVAFFLPALLGVATSLLWFFGVKNYRSERVTERVQSTAAEEGADGIGRALLRAGIPFVFLCVLLQGILRDGISSWMPTFVAETYKIENIGAIMTAGILPVFSLLCVYLTGRIHKRIDNEQKTAIIFWGISTVAALLLMLVYHQSIAVLTVAFMGILNACSHGINYLLTSRVSPRFVKYHKVSTITGTINACTYLGAALAGWLSPLLSEHFGWGVTLWSWAGTAALGLALTLISVRRYTKFLRED